MILHRKSLRSLIALLGLFVLTTASRAETTEDLASLAVRWEEAMEQLQVPGMAVAVVQGDQVLLTRGFGVRDTETSLPVDPDTLFYIASSTKSVVATAIQTLVEEGKIVLDAPVTTYLPRFAVARASDENPITVLDLLTHRRGLSSDKITQGEAYTGLMDEDQFYRLLAEVEPTEEFLYSNLNFTLLGRIIEAVAGTHWQDFVEQRITGPIGMDRATTSASKMWADENTAIPTIETAGQWQRSPVLKTDRTMHAAGGMAASANDLAQWLRFTLGDGSIDGHRILAAESLREMHRAHVDIERDFFTFQRKGYGLGWYTGEYAGEKMVHHFGAYVGARAHVSFLPDHGIGVAVVQNNADPTLFFADIVAADVYRVLAGVEGPDVLSTFVDRVRERRESQAERHAARRLLGAGDLSLPTAQYAAHYEHDDWGQIEITLDGDQIAASWGDLDPALVASTIDPFSFETTPGDESEGAFIVDPTSGTVRAITLEVDGETVRFDRVAEEKPGHDPAPE